MTRKAKEGTKRYCMLEVVMARVSKNIYIHKDSKFVTILMRVSKMMEEMWMMPMVVTCRKKMKRARKMVKHHVG